MNMQLLLAAAASELESMRDKEELSEQKRVGMYLQPCSHHTRFPSACMNLLYSIPGT